MKSAEQNIISFLKENPSVWSASALERMSFRNKNGTLNKDNIYSVLNQIQKLEGLPLTLPPKKTPLQSKGDGI